MTGAALPPEFRIKVMGFIVPEILVRPNARGGNDLIVRDEELGWFTVPDHPMWRVEYRDETAWALLPIEVCQASTDKGWNKCTAGELIGILWTAGVLR